MKRAGMFIALLASAVFAGDALAGAPRNVAPQHDPSPPASLLPIGTPAPDFTVKDAAGHRVKLSDFRGKTVVLAFWSTWCVPCQQSLPHINQVARTFMRKNVVVLAVNVWDTPGAFRYWLPRHKSYDSLVFAVDTRDYGRYVTTLYRVPEVPTEYVIDPSGKIAATVVGYEKPTDDLAKAIVKAAGTSQTTQLGRNQGTSRPPG